MRQQAPVRHTPSVAPAGSARRLVRCSAGSETYCIDNEWLDSIHVIENLYPRKGADGSIGWIRRFDEKVPVYRLTDQLDKPGRPAQPHGVIMVIEKNQRAWALLVDKVSAAAEVPGERVFPMPGVMGDAARTRFPSVVIDSGDLTLYLAPDHVVPADVAGLASTAKRADSPILQAPRLAVPPSRPPRVPQSQPAATSASPSIRASARQIVTFSLAHESRLAYPMRFAVSAGQALEIVGDLPMIQVPDSPPFVQALASWRSLPVPMMDLASWLGLPPAPYRPGSRILVCRSTQALGRGENGLIAITGVEDIRKLDLPIQCAPWSDGVSWNASLALGVYLAERGMLVVPDIDAVFRFQSSASPYTM